MKETDVKRRQKEHNNDKNWKIIGIESEKFLKEQKYAKRLKNFDKVITRRIHY